MRLLLWLTRWFKPSSPRKQTGKQKTGAWGEACAAAFLKKSGYRIQGKNIRPNRHDEIDLIATKNNTTFFVEVKTRQTEEFGRPLAAAGNAKRRCLRRAANAWLRQNGGFERRYQFDVIEVIGSPEAGQPPCIRHIQGIDMTRTRSPFH